MTQIQIPSASPSGAGTKVTESKFAVEVAVTWGGDWLRCNWLYPSTAGIAVAPSIGEASFEFEYGSIIRPGRTSKSYYDALKIWDTSRYIRIVELNTGLVWWTGLIDNESILPFGGTGGAGDQIFGAWELSHLLERAEVEHAQGRNGSGNTVTLDWAPTINARDCKGRTRGNRSSTVNGDGVYEFSDQGSLWSNLDAVQMLLTNYAPADGPDFVLGGQYAVLDSFHDTLEIDGRSVWDCLNDLIDRRRGLGFVPIVSGDSVVLYVFTTVDAAVSVGGVQVPANPMTVTFDLDSRIELQQCKILRSNAVRYDQIKVIGNRILSCFTVAQADATLANDWVAADETAYETGASSAAGYAGLSEADKEELNDSLRASDRFAAVYVRQRIPRNWNGQAGNGEGGAKTPCLPVCSDVGVVTVPAGAPLCPLDKRFEDFLPFEEGKDYSAGVPTAATEPTLLAPLVLVKDEETTPRWHLVNDPGPGLKEDGAAADVMVYPTGMAIGIKGSPNHVYGKGLYSGSSQPSATAALLDLSKTLATVAMFTDSALKVRVTRADASSYLKKKVIRIPDAEYWYVAAGTVLGISEDGTLKRVPSALVLRNDISRLSEVAAQALAWYGAERRSVMVPIKGLMQVATLGTFLQSIYSAGTELRSNTILSSMSWNFKDRSTQVETAWAEFDWAQER